MTADTPPQVATAAQIPAALPLHELTLIGLFSGAETRTALLRNTAGQIAHVATGQTIFGITVQAIDDTTLHATDARGRAVTLQMPAG